MLPLIERREIKLYPAPSQLLGVKNDDLIELPKKRLNAHAVGFVSPESCEIDLSRITKTAGGEWKVVFRGQPKSVMYGVMEGRILKRHVSSGEGLNFIVLERQYAYDYEGEMSGPMVAFYDPR